MAVHPLLAMMYAAGVGEFPATDGGVTFLRPHRRGIEAVVAFTGHAVMMTELRREDFEGIPIDGLGRAQHPDALLRLARGGTVGVLDATLVWNGTESIRGEVAEVSRTDRLVDHHRVRHATRFRRGVEVFANEHGLVTLATGLAGRREMSVEVFEPGRGRGRALIRAAQSRAGAEPLFAAVSPGNVRSFRAFQAEGFSLICSEVVIAVG